VWIFLTRRLRTWLLLAVTLPLVRLLVHRLAVSARQRDARSAGMLQHADSALSRRASRGTRRRRGRRR
jgi:hypothetical protein